MNFKRSYERWDCDKCNWESDIPCPKHYIRNQSMKAKDLAFELMKNPELEVEFAIYTGSSSTGLVGGIAVDEIEIKNGKITIFIIE
jgi:hypothetical protein